MRTCTSFVLMLVLSTTSLSAEQRIDLEFTTHDRSSLRVDLEGVEGQVKIEGWDRDRVRVEGESWGAGNSCILDIWERRATIQVSHDCGSDRDRRRFKVDLVVKVPKRFNIQLQAVTETSIQSVEGRFDLRLANANIELYELRGEIELSTANGQVTITGSELVGDISNVNGKLRILRSNVSGKISTTNASQEISGADGELALKSVNGSVDVGSASAFVNANTVNGNVRIRELNGAIEAETVNGNVEFEMIGSHDINIETTNGRVDLKLPQDFSMEVDIKVRNKGGRRELYGIFSDFKIAIDEGVRRYDAVASGRVAGGRNKVRIHTVNGDVYLRKAR